MLGKRAMESAHVFVQELGLEGKLEPEEFLRQREAALESLFPTSRPMPGVGKEWRVESWWGGRGGERKGGGRYRGREENRWPHECSPGDW